MVKSSIHTSPNLMNSEITQQRYEKALEISFCKPKNFKYNNERKYGHENY